MQSRVATQPSPAVSIARLLPERKLLAAAAKGDERAFAQLYHRFHQPLYRYLCGLLSDPHEAEDALQNTFLQALRSVRAGATVKAVRPWLFRIAHNEGVGLIRRRQRPVEPASQEEGGPSLEQVAEQRADLAQLVEDLRALGVRQRAALLLHELNGLPVAEVGEALGCSAGAAKQLLFEARTALHDFAEGRSMECELVRMQISERDGRLLRGRKVAAHLRSCPGCRQFREEIEQRRLALNALIPPLSPLAAGALLSRLIGAAKGSGPGSASGAVATAGVHPLAGLATKAAVLAVLAVGGGVGAVAATSSSHPARRHSAVSALGDGGRRGGVPTGGGPLRTGVDGATSRKARIASLGHPDRRSTAAQSAASHPAQTPVQRRSVGTGAAAGAAERASQPVQTAPSSGEPVRAEGEGGRRSGRQRGPAHPVGRERAQEERELHPPQRPFQSGAGEGRPQPPTQPPQREAETGRPSEPGRPEGVPPAAEEARRERP